MTKQVVCVTTAGRTGSTWLCDIYLQNNFNILRHVSCHDFYAFDLLDHMTFQNGKYVFNNNTYLEKVVFHNHDPSWLPHDSEYKIKVILSFRKDKILQQLSHVIWKYIDQVLDDNTLAKAGPAHAPNPDYIDPIDIKKLYVDPQQLLKDIKTIVEFEEAALKTVQDNCIDYLILYYEDLFSNSQSDILKQLGISVKQDTYFKKGRFQAQDIIENYEELVQLEWGDQI